MTSPQTDQRPIVAITMGDPAGIGPEIAIRVLADTSTYGLCRPVLVGDGSVLQATMAGMKLPTRLHPIARVTDALFVPECIELIDSQNVDMQHLKKAQVSAMAGAAAYAYIIRATDMALAGEIDAVVTCPINKDALNQAGYHYPGHTEILADRTSTRDFAMMLVAGGLRVVLVTIHLALEEAVKQIQEARILNTIRLDDGHRESPYRCARCQSARRRRWHVWFRRDRDYRTYH